VLCCSCPALHPPLPDSEEDDPELLLHIPFNGSVKLTGITVVGGPDGASPAKLKASTSSGGRVGGGLQDCSVALRLAARCVKVDGPCNAMGMLAGRA